MIQKHAAYFRIKCGVNGKEFCSSHCSFLKEHAPAVPTGLKEFVQYCGVVIEGK